MSLTYRQLLVMLAITLMLSACASRFPPSPNPVPSPEPPNFNPAGVGHGDVLEVGYYLRNREEPSGYLVDVGDTLAVEVMEHPELSREAATVLPDGRITLKLLGPVRVSGQSVEDIRAALTKAYRQMRIQDPEVLVSVLKGQQRLREFMNFIGAGQGVNRIRLRVFDDRPVDLPLMGPVNVARPLEAIRSDVRAFYSKEFNDQLEVTVNLVERPASGVYIMGEVREPGLKVIDRPLALLAAIAAAGGFAETADERAVLLVRFRPSGQYDYWTFDLNRGLLSEAAPAGFMVQPRDLVYVARSPIADANLFVKQYIRGLLPLETGFAFGFTLNAK